MYFNCDTGRQYNKYNGVIVRLSGLATFLYILSGEYWTHGQCGPKHTDKAAKQFPLCFNSGIFFTGQVSYLTSVQLIMCLSSWRPDGRQKAPKAMEKLLTWQGRVFKFDLMYWPGQFIHLALVKMAAVQICCWCLWDTGFSQSLAVIKYELYL